MFSIKDNGMNLNLYQCLKSIQFNSDWKTLREDSGGKKMRSTFPKNVHYFLDIGLTYM